MKVLFGLLMLIMAGFTASAQDTKNLFERYSMAEKLVKNSPFSADAVSESVQTLADGNRIVRSSTNKLYRNSEGRFRRDLGTGAGSGLGSFYSFGPGFSIFDPVGGFQYQYDTNLKTAWQAYLKPSEELKVTAAKVEKLMGELKMNELKMGELKDKAAAKESAKDHIGVISRATGLATFYEQSKDGPAVVHFGSRSNTKYESRIEQLGIQNFEGIDAEGTRSITTIPAGAIGNERPIEIVYERWYSNELQLVVMSKHSDPRSGEQTYRLTNITRSEPDPSLFSLPTGYKVILEPGTAAPVGPQKMKMVKASAPAKPPVPVMYVKDKP